MKVFVTTQVVCPLKVQCYQLKCFETNITWNHSNQFWSNWKRSFCLLTQSIFRFLFKFFKFILRLVTLSLFDRNHIGRRTFSKSPTTHGRQSFSFRNYNARQYDFERYSVLVWYFHTGIYFLADSLSHNLIGKKQEKLTTTIDLLKWQ